MEKETTGLLVALVGINNIGKTTQVRALPAALAVYGRSACTQKYPVYDCAPSGPRIDAFLRNGNPEALTALQFQALCAQNRKDFEPELARLLREHDVVITEMYTESGIAFGLGDSIPKAELLAMNEELRPSDLVILLDGERFKDAKESGHYFESDDERMAVIRRHHLDLAAERGWQVIDANRPREAVLYDIANRIIKARE